MTSQGKYSVTRSRPETPVSFGNRILRQYDSSLPPTILSGVVWHNTPGIFSKWKEVFLILNRDTIRWHQIQRTTSINHHQVGPTIASLNLILISDVSLVERKGYLTICIEAGGVGSNFFRRTSLLRHWGELIRETVLRKREEFGCVSLASLSLYSGSELLSEKRRQQRPTQRFYRSKSSGNLLESSQYQREEDSDEVDFKQCLIQQDEHEQDYRDVQTDFHRQRLAASNLNLPAEFRRYS